MIEAKTKIDHSLIKKISVLTCINFTKAEEEKFLIEFEPIIDWINNITKIDTSSIQKINKITKQQNITLHEDVVIKDTDKNQIMMNVANKNNDFIVLPKLR